MRRVSRSVVLVLLAGCLFFFVGAAASFAQGPVDHSLFAGLLGKYVSSGVVDYKGFKRDEQVLDLYLSVLEKSPTAKLSRAEQLAFYINAYNAWTIKLILSKYPDVKSIWDLGSRIIPWRSPFRKKIVRINGGTISLDQLEHEIVRPRFKDPRVHFSLNCAARSCPPLSSVPYVANRLDVQLDEAASAFLTNPQRNYLKGNELYVSSIFKWFEEDFGTDIVGFFLRFAKGAMAEQLVARRDQIQIRYLDYDWSLNGK